MLPKRGKADRRDADSRNGRSGKGAPSSSRDKCEREQQRKMRLDRQKTDQDARHGRLAVEQEQSEPGQSGGEKTVLPGIQV